MPAPQRPFRLQVRAVGQQVAVATVNEPYAVEFRRSPCRRLVGAVVALLVIAAAVTAATVLGDQRPWWGLLLLYGPIAITSGALARRARRRQPRLPLRLTDTALEVTGPDGSTLAIDLSNIARARVHGWLEPRLTVEPVDPQRTQPPLKAQQWSRLGRPYDLVIPLDWMSPGRDALRRELAQRLPARTQ